MSRRAPTPLTVFAVASLGIFVAFVDATIVNIAFPDIARSFPGAGFSDLSWVLNAYNIVFAAFLVAAGRLADVVGRRRLFVFGVALFTFASALCAVAPSAGALIAFRAIQALGAAALVPASLGLVLEGFPAERRPHAVALLTAVGAAAAGIGPSLGGFLVSAADWRLVFLVNVPIGIATIVLARRHLVESRAPGRRRLPDLPGALALALATGLLVLAISKGGEWGWAGARTLGALAVAGAFGVIFARRCTRHRAPLIDPAVLRAPGFALSNSLTVVAAAGFYGYTLLNVLFLTGVWRYTAVEAGLAITPGPLVAMAVAGPSSRLAERLGPRPVLVVGGLVWAAGVWWLIARVGAAPEFVAEWLPGTILLGLGAGATLSNLSSVAINSAPGEGFATATGLNSVARQVGGALGVALVVAVLGVPTAAEAMDAFDGAWALTAGCLAAGAFGALALRRLPAAPADEEVPDLAAAARGVFAPPAAPPPEALVPAAAPRLETPAPPRPETVNAFLAGVPAFAGLAREQREDLASAAREVRLEAGEVLFEAGDAAAEMYVVRAGRLEVLGEDGALIRELGRGQALGELALLTGEPRSAGVRAGRGSELIAISAAEFERAARAAPELGLALSRTLAAELAQHRAPVPAEPAPPATVTLVALDEEAPAAEIGRAVAGELARWERVAVLDGSEVEAPAREDAAAATYGPLLDRCERDHERVVMLGGAVAEPSAWGRFCRQHADRLLAVGGAAAGGGAPDSVPAELRGCDLLACGVEPGSGALAGWAAALEPRRCHALGGTRDGAGIARVARRLGGRSLGIVLSGGGARAFAHLGVLEELIRAGVELDRVGGVSMGAFVGALFALGLSPEEIDARCYEEWVRRNPIGDYTLPRHALIRGRRFEAMLERSFGAAAIEELGRSFFCASAELRSGELAIHGSGPLAEAVGLSAALPVLGPPQVRGRRILVDGSLVDNLPVAEMAARGEGPVIAVDVKARFERPAATEGNGAQPPPYIGETLARVLLLASSDTTAAAERHAALTIRPRCEGVGLLEFHQLDRAVEAGRAAAREALDEEPEASSAVGFATQ